MQPGKPDLNPPVIDGKLITLRMNGSNVEVSGAKAAVTPGGSSVEITNEATGEKVVTTAAANGTFTTEIAGSLNDSLDVRATANGKSSSVLTCNDGGCGMLSLECWTREEMASLQGQRVLATADLACTSDADCVTAPVSVSCYDTCDPEQVFSKDGADAVGSELGRIEREVCRDFKQRGCAVAVSCHKASTGSPECRKGTCQRVDSDGCSCLRSAMSWGYVGGTGQFPQSSLGDCAHYARNFEGSDPLSCEADLDACSADASLAAVMSAVADSDVRQALTGPPVVFGVDHRSNGGSAFRITMGGGEIVLGDPCSRSSGCAIPAGVQALADRLIAIDEQLSDSSCSGLPACPVGKKNATVCTACGSAGGCGTRSTTCAKPCSDDADCADDPNGSSCFQGLCQTAQCD